MANFITKSYNDAPAWAKGILLIGGVYIGYQLVNFTLAKIKNLQDVKDVTQESNTATTELEQLAQQGIKPTLSAGQIDTNINKIVEAVNGCGTDEQAIYSVFNTLKNIADLKLLVQNWKIQYYRPCAATEPISYAKWLNNTKSYGGSLNTFLNYDLSVSEINSINNILRSKGINYTL
jgi:hypothetical protein